MTPTKPSVALISFVAFSQCKTWLLFFACVHCDVVLDVENICWGLFRSTPNFSDRKQWNVSVINRESECLLVLAIHLVSPWYDPSWLSGCKTSSVYLSQLKPYSEVHPVLDKKVAYATIFPHLYILIYIYIYIYMCMFAHLYTNAVLSTLGILVMGFVMSWTVAEESESNPDIGISTQTNTLLWSQLSGWNRHDAIRDSVVSIWLGH